MNFVSALLWLQTEGELPPEAAAAAAGLGIGFTVVMLLVALVLVVAMWKIFEKAGKPGWASLIPVYNLIVLMEIAGKPAWWVVLFFIPFVNFVVAIMLGIAVAKNFGKSTGFGLGLAFLGVIFAPILAWGDSRYQPQSS
jgi:hypothetical protein